MKSFHNGYRNLQQTFRRTQPEVQAVEGEDIVLPCEIDNLHGRVQWTLDGMALVPDFLTWETEIDGTFVFLSLEKAAKKPHERGCEFQSPET
ncbi:hypothetical protein V9T40_012974 [Parthenolecanium corni]|uniref:Ig-like domain-containing protein n=1 Tax=Parthenolecanium corni TaxID=536013 RepID=A0AAN9T862_9HEMI